MTFLELAIEVIKKQNTPMSAQEIWKRAVEMKLDSHLQTYGQTPADTLRSAIYVNIKQKGANSPFVQVSKNPTLFFLKELNSPSVVIPDIQVEENDSVKERSLHKILSSFVFSDPHFNCYTKTIFHEKSAKKKKGKNEWLHPDIVGIRYPFDDFRSDTCNLMKAMEHSNYKVFSFELKISLTYASLREYFFQAVSNSSWANEGYLVALNYEDAPDFMDELRRLNNVE